MPEPDRLHGVPPIDEVLGRLERLSLAIRALSQEASESAIAEFRVSAVHAYEVALRVPFVEPDNAHAIRGVLGDEEQEALFAALERSLSQVQPDPPLQEIHVPGGSRERQ